MAYDEDLANRIRELVATEEGVTEKKMFGGLAFLIGGNMSVSASGQGGLLLRCDPAETEALLQKPHAAPFEMRGRTMDGNCSSAANSLRERSGVAISDSCARVTQSVSGMSSPSIPLKR